MRLLNALIIVRIWGLKVRFSLATIAFDRESAQMSPPILTIISAFSSLKEFGESLEGSQVPLSFVAHDCGYPLSRYTCRATRVAADFLDFIAFFAGVAPVSRYTP